MPPPRPAERLRALRCVLKAVWVRLQRWVRMVRVVAAREKVSEAFWVWRIWDGVGAVWLDVVVVEDEEEE